jgi:hypothetical protein
MSRYTLFMGFQGSRRRVPWRQAPAQGQCGWACTPPRHFAATWEFGGGVSWIDVKLAPEGGRARLTPEHIAIVEDHWKRFGPGAVGIGWDLALIGLGRHLASGAPVDREAAMAWMGSPNAKTSMLPASLEMHPAAAPAPTSDMRRRVLAMIWQWAAPRFSY